MPPRIKLILVDLRREKHGFLNGEPISWIGIGKRKIDQDRLEQEEETIACFDEMSELVVSDRSGPTYTISKLKLETEVEIARKLGIELKSFFTKNHAAPSDETIDQFVEFVEGLDPNTWVHFHCHEGAGRATTYMIMFDMLHHVDQIPKKEILRRQFLIGGVNIAKYDKYANFDKFLDEFYRFAKMRAEDKSLSWSTYIHN